MLQIILKLIGIIFLAVSVVMVYDARLLTNKWFSFGDQNEASTGFKILGFILFVVGGIIIYFNR